ncbi:MAG: VanZ family protein [Candidatus Zapsychrus exili]|nr:VanZ family protein [Candidatus Zapsychrus exili]
MKERLKRWGSVFAWTTLIYSTLYIVRPICSFLKENIPFSIVANFLLVALFSAIIFLFLRKVKVRMISTYVLLLLILSMYLFGFMSIKITEEKIHFIEYGILVFLVYWASIVDFKDPHSYIIAFFVAFFVGWADEGIQYLLPNRYYDIRDVVFNGVGSALGLCLIFIMRREIIQKTPSI